MKYDVVVIGSGISGMTAAALLAREGKRVLVLEQHNVFGGLLQTFRRDRLTFPTGVHCVGSLREGQVMRRYLEYVDVFDRLELVEMNPEGFQEFVFPGARYVLPTGHQAFKERLLEYFPEERRAVETYLDDMREVVSSIPFYQLDPTLSYSDNPVYRRPLADYLDAITENPQLKALLAANNPLYGLAPSECPVRTHMIVTDSFLNSSFRVDDRRRPISKAFVAALRDAGVELRREARVQRITTSNQRITGVELSDGERISSDLVVFGGHPKALTELMPNGGLRPAFKKRVADLEDTKSFFTANFAWEGSECPLAACDTFTYRSWDVEKQYRDESDANDPHMIYFAAAPRPERGRRATVAMTVSDWEVWNEWNESRTGEREPDYAERKNALAASIRNTMNQTWPDAGDCITEIDSNTPLTVRDYTLSPRGTGYGVKRSSDNYFESTLSVKTSVKGLYLTGQSVMLPGLVGSLISGAVAAGAIVGPEYLLDKIACATRTRCTSSP